KRFPGTNAAEVSAHRALTQFGFKERGHSSGVTKRCADLDCSANCVIAAQGENNDAYGAAGGAKECIVGAHHAVGIADEVLRVLQRWIAKRRANVQSYSSARARPNELGVPCITRPLRGRRANFPVWLLLTQSTKSEIS